MFGYAGAASFFGGRTAMGLIGGAVAGGVFGAFSDNTSVLGGALGGALIGGAGARYLGAGMKYGSKFGKRLGTAKAFGLGTVARARLDFRAAKNAFFGEPAVAANAGVNKVASTLKGPAVSPGFRGSRRSSSKLASRLRRRREAPIRSRIGSIHRAM